ncbi:MAG: VanZ family protein [Bacteroidales bacterium]|nr:VanZ family protein [Bacteroidales bacterium]
MSRRARILFRILFVLYIAGLAFLCFGHFNNLPDVPRKLLGIQMGKIVHFCMFLPFPPLQFLAIDKYTVKPWHSLLMALGIFVLGCLLAAGTELIQGYLPHRTADHLDFRADALALAVSSLAVLIIDLAKQFRHK